ncbi:replication restart DNA helicase PriA [Microbacterium azadirachtae]|uniref:Probable replication restart protein PriA n=1 Tax=Microbacterium azadirachtae TaxID=582680 RepID=A0A1I6FYI4_9MICO|nr:primosomal protein N' [Microbacterium azadirachtae]SFR34993.1 replication restart DNA helicase PriA [Microbacterium azadirachtae]
MPRPIARVLLDSPVPQLDRLFDYAIPEELTDDALAGVRVRVPLRSAGRVVDAFVVEVAVEEDDARALAELDAVVSRAQVLPERLHALARRVADRAAGGASDVLRLIVPKRQVRVEKAWLAAGSEKPEGPRSPAEGGAEPPSTAEDSTLASPVAETLAQYAGLADVIAEKGRAAVEAVPRLASDDLPEWTRLLAAAAAHTLEAGESSILVVPDYRDLDLLISALQALAPDAPIVRLDSRQSGPDRYRAYLRTLEDAPCIVIGNRSAAYAPVRAGLVALWDDGDSLLAEPLAPGVHARDVALLRQEQEGSALLFAGHTRTTDVERLVESGWCRAIAAERRLLPRVVLDSTEDLDRRGQRLPSRAFLTAREAAATGPVLLQVARPGFSPTLVCASCRAPARCRSCGGPLGAAHRGATPVCAWCGRGARAWSCSACGSEKVRLAASGSERTAEELGRAFPGIRVIVADGAHPVERVDAKPALVVATRGAEPLAIGGYRAVVLLDGSRMLQAPELRIGESCLRWWSNAAALAAPGAPVHLVGVDGAVARALATWSQASYARSELAERAPLRMPPTVRVAQLEGTGAGVRRALDDLAALNLPQDAVLGPVPIDGDPDERERALVRFPYAEGTRVASTLRAAVVAEAMGRRRGRGRTARTTLSVRLDVIEPDL